MAHITTPTEFLGFQPGEDRKLAGWPTIVRYLKLLEQASDRVRVEEIGRSTEDNPFLVCTISSPDNLANAERLRLIQQSLSDPRTIDEGTAHDLVDECPRGGRDHVQHSRHRGRSHPRCPSNSPTC